MPKTNFNTDLETQIEILFRERELLRIAKEILDYERRISELRVEYQQLEKELQYDTEKNIT